MTLMPSTTDYPTRGRGLIRNRAAVFGLLVLLACPAAAKETFGWLERVRIGPKRLVLSAKLDTGADHSSIDASDIHRFQRGGQRYVRFTLRDPSTGEDLVVVERILLRRAVVKRHGGLHQRRPVVAMDVCLGGHKLRKIEVSLVDRSEFNHALLLGRSALEGIAVVDPERTFTQEPRCEPGEPRP